MKKKTVKSTQNEQIPVILHGEAMIFRSTLPEGAKRIQPTTPEYLIIADSETTGNHHVVDVNPGTEFFMDDKGTMYMVATEDTSVRCIHTNRHDSLPIQSGCWEFGIQQETDHLARHKRNVRD